MSEKSNGARFDTELADKKMHQALGSKAKSEHRSRRKTVKHGEATSGDNAPFFEVLDDGLYYFEVRSDVWRSIWVCGRLEIQHIFRNEEGRDWGLCIKLTDRDGAERLVFLRQAEIIGQGWHKPLSDHGLKIDHSQAKRLAEFLTLRTDSAPRARIVYQPGLYGDSFVRADRSFGEMAEPLIIEPSGRLQAFGESGTLAQWNERIGRYCVGNSRLILGVCASLASALLDVLGIDGGGFNVFGESSIGKTTVLIVSASVNGPPEKYIQTWRSTSNAIEGTAANFNHSLLCLDEIREANDREVVLIVMMLANGQGKGRMSDTAKLKESHVWKINWLSTGEHKTTHYVEQAGDKVDAGMEIRQADIPADPGKGQGVFEAVHDMPSAKALAEKFKSDCGKYFGTLGAAWLEYLVADLRNVRKALPAQVDELAASLSPTGAESQVTRVMRRFALCALAGELAVGYGLLAWPPGEATKGIKQCAQDWIRERGGVGNMEQRRYIERLSGFLMANWSSRFVPWDRVADDHAPGKNEVVGVRKTRLPKTTTEYVEDLNESSYKSDEFYASATHEFFITAPGWKEIFKGMNPKAAADTLAAAGFLEKGPKGENYLKGRLPGLGQVRYYKPRPALMDYLEGSNDAS